LRVFENRVRRKILGPEKDGVTGEWRRLIDEELYNVYCSQKFRVIKSRRMSWAGMWHLRWAGEIQTGFWWGNLRERDHLEDLGVDGKKIFKCMSKNWEGEALGLDLA